MALINLLNRPVALTIRRRPSDPELDEYGNEIPDEQLVQTVCELQQTRRSEPGGEGELSQTDWLLILPAGTLARTGDTAIVDDQEYELIGDPWIARNPRTQVISHIECTVRRTAGADDEAQGS